VKDLRTDQLMHIPQMFKRLHTCSELTICSTLQDTRS